MDTKTLISEAKARFSHNAAKAILNEKYNNKLLIAEQGGLWKADQSTIAFLSCVMHTQETIVLTDTFNNLVKVNSFQLYCKLLETYNKVMNDWYEELLSLEKVR